MTTIARNTPEQGGMEARDEIRIRLATPSDAPAVCDIYEPYVLHTAITFDMKPPSTDDMAEKIAHTLSERPFLIAETENGEIVGYAYASPFRPREAYIHAIETSVYLRPDQKGAGLGRRLYTALEDILRLQNVYTANACISYVEPPDEYSPDTSRKFHERLGYTLCAHIPNCGRKFDRWYGIIWMQKELMPLPETPDIFVPLPLVPDDELIAILARA